MQTIRYCVAITDVLCILPIARAVYLPLAQFEHDCFANTSIVFHKNQLKLFYLPKNKLDEKSLQSLENKIGVPFKKLNSKDIKVNFQYEITTKEESVNLYVLNKLRLLNCKCGRCLTSKLTVDSLNIKLFDHLMKKNEIEMDEDNYILMDDYEQLNNQIDYDNEFGQLSKVNLLYGNRNDTEYSKKIYSLIIEMIDTFQNIFGYYHPQVTIYLLLINSCHFTIVKSCTDTIELFYRYKYFHSFIVQLQESVRNF